jgi:hypothetical protein
MTTAITHHLDAHAALAPLASRLVDVDALAWQSLWGVMHAAKSAAV